MLILFHTLVSEPHHKPHLCLLSQPPYSWMARLVAKKRFVSDAAADGGVAYQVDLFAECDIQEEKM